MVKFEKGQIVNDDYFRMDENSVRAGVEVKVITDCVIGIIDYHMV
jgi:hypothetical protein